MTSQDTVALHRCGSCGHDLRVSARFCDACGSPVVFAAAPAERKQVTVLFADVVGSMSLAAALDSERLQAIMTEFFNRAAAVVQRYLGTVDKFTGDGLMALFGAPSALEDHALRAGIAALEMQSEAAALSAELSGRDGIALRIRVGLNSGEVVAGEIGSGPGRYTAVGHSVGMAQRMEAAAPSGGVLCSISTARLIGDAALLGPVEMVALKSSGSAVPARRLLAVESDRMVLGRNEGRLIGRDAEVRSLQTLFDSGTGGLAAVIGEPGVGKSRLLMEFTAGASEGGAEVVLARCESHTAGVAFRVLSRMLRGLFDVQGLDIPEARERTADQLGPSTGAADTQILFDAMGIADADGPLAAMSIDGRRRRLVAMMVQAVGRRGRRVVFALEDAHWIDTPSDDVLADFATALAPTDSMLIATYRPEFRGALDRNARRRIPLRKLSRDNAIDLVRQVLGDDPSVRALGESIAETATGNPFFIEEIIRDLAGRKLLDGSRGGYRLSGRIAGITVPPTVQAVLAARIDRLGPTAKSILNAAAVIGSRFDIDTLQMLVPQSLSDGLAELVAVELIDQTEFVPVQRFCFHHPLVRTVAYDSQLTATRTKAHRALATAIGRHTPAADEGASLIATHLAAAGDLPEAYHWHMRAADWLRPRDLAAARDQWECARRVADRMPDALDGVAGRRIAPRAMLISTSLYLCDELSSDARYHELYELATGAGDLTPLALAMAGRMFSMCINEVRVPDAVALAAELDTMMQSLRCDSTTRSIALNSLGFTRFANCEFEAAARACDEILALPDVSATETAPALALRGFIDICLGDAGHGRRQMLDGTLIARQLHPVNYAGVQLYSSILVALGMCHPDEMIEDKAAALQRAESFGDISGIVFAQWAYGTVLFRAQPSSTEAPTLLRLARANSQRYGLGACSLSTITPDLAVHAARDGRRDEVIAELREALRFYSQCFPAFAVFSAEALVGMLAERRYPDDLAEARLIVEQWSGRRRGAPGWELWLSRARALLAEAQGDSVAYREAAWRYLQQCEELDARGRLDDARRLVDRADPGGTA